MPQPPRVALLIEMSGVHGRRILEGVTEYLRSHRAWSLVLEHRDVESSPPRWLAAGEVDGVISRWSGPKIAKALRGLGAPAVDVSSRHPAFGPPRITTDDRAVGEMAAEHLMERRLRSFLYCGIEGELWSARRRDGFAEAVARAGFEAEVFDAPSGGHRRQADERELAQLGRCLRGLPRPAGVMVCKDLHGPHVLEACRRFDLRVPDDVAVVGADDDALLCGLSDPPLSSVVCNPEQIGFLAASTLDRMMAGDPAGFDERQVPPVGVTARLSSDVLAIDDELIVAAVRFIRANACHGITTGDVLDHLATSRTTLDRRFQKYLRRSPQAEIRAVQLGRARQLLAETGHPMARIAELVGFKYSEYFHAAFKREFGLTPGEFRREARSGDRHPAQTPRSSER